MVDTGVPGVPGTGGSHHDGNTQVSRSENGTARHKTEKQARSETNTKTIHSSLHMHARSCAFLVVLACGLASISAQTATQDVVQIVSGSDVHTTLETLVGAADLVDTLSSLTSNFTVFAPTDAAFLKLPEATLTCLQLAANKDLLSNLLQYHVVSGRVLSTDLMNGTITPLGSFSNTPYTFSTPNKLMASAASFIDTTALDIKATNGVVHVIDTVLVPTVFECTVPTTTAAANGGTTAAAANGGTTAAAAGGTTAAAANGGGGGGAGATTTPTPSTGSNTIVGIAQASGLTTLVGFVTQAGLVSTLSDANADVTVFAPTDAAFQALQTDYPDVATCLLEEANKPLLVELLKYHVHGAEVMAANLPTGSVSTIADGTFFAKNIPRADIQTSPGLTDVIASNGIVHVVSKALVPKGFACPANRAISISTTLEGMTIDAFDAAAETTFKTEVAKLMTGKNVDDIVITGKSEVTRRRMLLAAGLKVDYQVLNFATEDDAKSAAGDIQAKAQELVDGLKAADADKFSALTGVSNDFGDLDVPSAVAARAASWGVALMAVAACLLAA